MDDNNSIKKLAISLKDVIDSGNICFKEIAINKNYDKSLSKFFEKFYNASGYLSNLINEMNVLKRDYLKLKEKISDPNNNSNLELIMNFINNRAYLIRIFYSFKKDKNNKNYIERYLDTLNFIKYKCDEQKKKILKEKIIEKEKIFIKNNREKIKKIWEKKLII